MEKLRIEIGDKPMVVEPEMTVEVNEEFPKEIRSGYFEVMADLPKPVIDNNLRLAL
jgi:hypothetical protein